MLGIERLLLEVEKKGVADAPGAFNPINYLAQYLMRNNPRYNFAEASQYNKAMRLVQEELKDRAYELSGNRQAKLQADVERRRKAAEAEELRRHAHWAAVLAPVTKCFPDWDDSGYGLHAEALIAALRDFTPSLKASQLAELPEAVKAVLSFDSLPLFTADTNVPVTTDVFVQQLGPLLEDAPASLVELLAKHLNLQFGGLGTSDRVFQALFEELTVPPSRSRLLAALQDFYEDAKQLPNIQLSRPRAYSFNSERLACPRVQCSDTVQPLRRHLARAGHAARRADQQHGVALPLAQPVPICAHGDAAATARPHAVHHALRVHRRHLRHDRPGAARRAGCQAGCIRAHGAARDARAAGRTRGCRGRGQGGGSPAQNAQRSV